MGKNRAFQSSPASVEDLRMLRCASTSVAGGEADVLQQRSGVWKWKGRGEKTCQGRWNILGCHFIKSWPSLNGTSIYLRMKRKKAREGEVIRQAEGDRRARGGLEA